MLRGGVRAWGRRGKEGQEGADNRNEGEKQDPDSDGQRALGSELLLRQTDVSHITSYAVS